MSETVGEAVVRIRSDESGFDPADAGKKAGKGYSTGFSGAIKGLGTTLAASLAAAGVGSFIKGTITGASDMQETISKTGVVFGKAAEDILAFASTGAAALGLSKQAALDAAGTFGVFGKAAGLTGKGLSDFSTDLTSLSVDLASFHNADPQEVIEALGSALRGEAEPMRKFGVLLDDASLKNEALAQGLIKTTKDALTPQQKTLAAQALIMKQTSDAQGDFQRTSGGLANQQRILGATFKDLQAKIGVVFLPVVLAAVKGLVSLFNSADALGPVFSKIGSALGPALAPALDALDQFVRGLGLAFSVLASGEDVAAGLGETLDFALGNSGNLVGPITDAINVLSTAFSSVGQSIATNFLPVLTEVGAFVTNDVLPAVTALVGYIAANLVPVFAQVAEVVATQVVPTFAAIADFIYTTLYPAILQIVTAVAENLKPVFDQLVETFQTQVLPAIQSMVEQIRTQLIPALQPLITKIVAVVGFLLKLASTVLGFVLPPLIRLVGFIFANVVPAIVSIITWVAKFINGLLNLGRTIGVAIGRFAAFSSSITSGVVNAVSAVVSAIAGLPGKVLGFVSRMVSAGKSLIGGLFKGITSAAGAAGGFVGDLASKIVTAVKNAVNDALNLPLKISFHKGPINIDATVIPRLQSGSRGVDGGVYTVGEVGPERVYLPPGARVDTAAQTRQSDNRGWSPEAFAEALAAVLAPLLAGLRPVQFALPSGDPEAIAMAVVNRLATTD